MSEDSTIIQPPTGHAVERTGTLDNSEALGKVSVLTVDDDPQIARLVKAALNIFGFGNIHSEYSAESALEVLRTQPFHFIISDWQMKGMSGIEFVTHVRRSQNSPNRFIPIIMLTGKASRDDVQIARDAGVTEFIAKPFSIKELKRKIIEVIQNPRPFIVTKNYIGPDRRRKNTPLPEGMDERRKPKK